MLKYEYSHSFRKLICPLNFMQISPNFPPAAATAREVSASLSHFRVEKSVSEFSLILILILISKLK